MTLTDEERCRFAEYCHQQVLSCNEILKQLERFGAASVATHQKMMLAAYSFVAKDLDSIQSQTIEQSPECDRPD